MHCPATRNITAALLRAKVRSAPISPSVPSCVFYAHGHACSSARTATCHAHSAAQADILPALLPAKDCIVALDQLKKQATEDKNATAAATLEQQEKKVRALRSAAARNCAAATCLATTH